MADEQRPGGEATEPPSEKRLREARRRGQVVRSREITSLVVFAAGAAVLAWTWPGLLGELRALLEAGLRRAPFASSSPAAALQVGLGALVTALSPLLMAVFLAALLSSFAQVGALFTLQPLRPSLQRLSPGSNLPRVLGRQALWELAKTSLKLLLFGAVAWQALRDRLPLLLSTVGGPPRALLAALGETVMAIALRLGLLMALVAALDYLYQRRQHLRRLRMTPAEVRRELKESEGDPQHKAERRRLHQEILESQMLASVATADCVIINPTEVAVALRYDASRMTAPRVVARGERLVAARIRAEARRHGVPVIRNVPLARALLELELDQEIPAELYETVAEVLRFVYRISGRGEASR